MEQNGSRSCYIRLPGIQVMKIVFLFYILALMSCASTVEKTGCSHELASTTIKNGQYKIYIYNPDSLSNPSVWEGPICIENSKRQQTCEYTNSLIKSVEFFGSESISIITFSGSNSQTTNLNLATCLEF